MSRLNKRFRTALERTSIDRSATEGYGREDVPVSDEIRAVQNRLGTHEASSTALVLLQNVELASDVIDSMTLP
jgi:hypothetical protein